jgi:hypothetical protein
MQLLVIASAMAFEPGQRILGLWIAAAALVLAGTLPAAAAEPDKPKIYRCDIGGKKLTRDRPIAECSDRMQYLLNGDGSVNREIPPTMTVIEIEKKEQADLAREIQETKVKQEIRADRSLMLLYPNEAAHRKARDKALDEFRTSVSKLEESIATLNKDRKPLLDESEFYVGKPLPMKLKSALDANDASLAAKRALAQNQQSEVIRINATFEVELARLRKLWAGAQPGSLGPLPGTQQAVSVPAAAAAVTARTPDAAVKTTVK